MTPTRVVVDASVALKWMFAEDDSEIAELLLDLELLAPDFLLIECANAVWSRLQSGHIDSAEAHAALAGLAAVPISLTAASDLVAEALSFGEQLAHPVYDCAYLALAQREQIPLVTADRRFVAAIRRSGILLGGITLLSELREAWASEPGT